MPKLHELLAAEANVAAQANAIAEETLKVFGRPEAFIRTTTSVHHFAEEDQRLDVTETKELTTTVESRLAYGFGRPWTNHLDLLASKDRTNQEAKADVVVNGAVLLTGVPATFLLALEKHLADARKRLEAAPTLQAGVPWEWSEVDHLYIAGEPQVSFRTRKTVRPIIMAEATKEHPAQVQAISEDVPIARIEKLLASGMWTSAQKADALARLDALLVAVKKARQRANRADVVPMKVGQILARFILAGPAADKLTDQDSTD